VVAVVTPRVVSRSRPSRRVVPRGATAAAIVVTVGGCDVVGPEGGDGRASVGEDGGESVATGPQKGEVSKKKKKGTYKQRVRRRKEHGDAVRAAARGTATRLVRVQGHGEAGACQPRHVLSSLRHPLAVGSGGPSRERAAVSVVRRARRQGG
jgi:hypothetical protein